MSVEKHPIDEVIRGRRTVHIYEKTSIAKEDVIESLQLALTAPNHKFTFPWKFIVVGEETRQKIFDLCVAKSPGKEEKLRAKILNPGALVVFCCKKSEDPFTAREDYASVSIAIQNYCLAMAARGYYSKWSTGKMTTWQETYEALSVDESIDEIVGFVFAGSPAVAIPPQRRPLLDDVLTELA